MVDPHSTILAMTDPSFDDIAKLTAITGGFAVAIIAIIAGSARRIIATRAREDSRREIAAYIAEGTMTPEQGERLLEAGMRAWEKPCRTQA